MFSKGSKLYSILKGVCPQCNEDKVFIDKNPYNLKTTLKMHEKCSNCELKYMKEPAFFYGAMYVNYGITVAESVATFIIAFVLLKLPVFASFIAIVAVLILLTPVNLRLARMIWLNMFFNYDKQFKK